MQSVQPGVAGSCRTAEVNSLIHWHMRWQGSLIFKLQTPNDFESHGATESVVMFWVQSHWITLCFPFACEAKEKCEIFEAKCADRVLPPAQYSLPLAEEGKHRDIGNLLS